MQCGILCCECWLPINFILWCLPFSVLSLPPSLSLSLFFVVLTGRHAWHGRGCRLVGEAFPFFFFFPIAGLGFACILFVFVWIVSRVALGMRWSLFLLLWFHVVFRISQSVGTSSRSSCTVLVAYTSVLLFSVLIYN